MTRAQRTVGLALVVTLMTLTACNTERPAATPARLSIRLALGTYGGVDWVPTLMALEMLAKMGYDVQHTNYAQTELIVEALARGDADFGGASSRSLWAAVSKGANVMTIMEQMANEWQIYAIPEIQTCADLDGRRLAQHSESSAGKAMTDAYIAANCPGIEPQLLIIPGSENRAAALIASEIDATPLAIADVLQLEREAPRRFHTLTNFAVDLPDLLTILIDVNGDFAARHPQAVRDFIKAMLIAHRQIQDEPGAFEAAALRLSVADPQIVPDILDSYLAIDAFDANGGLTAEAVQYSLDYYVESQQLEPGLTVADVADFSYLEDVLDEIGRR